VLARDVSIPDPYYTIAGSFEAFRTRDIITLSLARVVYVAFQLQDQPTGGTVEVHNEAVQDVLASKLQSKDASIPQQRPRMALSRRRRSAQVAGEREPLGVSETS